MGLLKAAAKPKYVAETEFKDRCITVNSEKVSVQEADELAGTFLASCGHLKLPLGGRPRACARLVILLLSPAA